ncbi:hypothetical protein KQI42_15825 [Tissierella sp. MSJ-40]|uniref:Uncharacterized protein n=1 Tax=Tissierella simiarum TaxID=2841534 RepID=A0ABS6E985_9FIRM|nr:hypothetical protein [Tissierella simiarum]MBU5439484.1 hypothetical protein [Tissierella simiarum]
MQENIQVFVKFGGKKDLEQLQKGYVRMGNRDIYENFKVEDYEINKKGIKNENESTLFKLGNNIKIIDDPDTYYIPIFCLSQFEVNKVSVDRIKFKFTDEQIKKIPTAFGDHALIINKSMFIDNFVKNAETKKLMPEHKMVKYSDSIFLKSPIEELLNSGILESGKIVIGDIDRDFLDNSFFELPTIHKYQTEYRFILMNERSKDYFYFKIDTIYKYSKLLKVEDLLNSGTIQL